jgi:DNA invertase Pin-like site-specific DNA recombinase
MMLASSTRIFHVTYVFGALAEFEMEIIRQRTMAGLEAERARGRKGGRKPTMDEGKIQAHARDARGSGARGGGRLQGDALPLRGAGRYASEVRAGVESRTRWPGK